MDMNIRKLAAVAVLLGFAGVAYCQTPSSTPAALPVQEDVENVDSYDENLSDPEPESTPTNYVLEECMEIVHGMIEKNLDDFELREELCIQVLNNEGYAVLIKTWNGAHSDVVAVSVRLLVDWEDLYEADDEAYLTVVTGTYGLDPNAWHLMPITRSEYLVEFNRDLRLHEVEDVAVIKASDLAAIDSCANNLNQHQTQICGATLFNIPILNGWPFFRNCIRFASHIWVAVECVEVGESDEEEDH